RHAVTLRHDLRHPGTGCGSRPPGPLRRPVVTIRRTGGAGGACRGALVYSCPTGPTGEEVPPAARSETVGRGGCLVAGGERGPRRPVVTIRRIGGAGGACRVALVYSCPTGPA